MSKIWLIAGAMVLAGCSGPDVNSENKTEIAKQVAPMPKTRPKANPTLTVPQKREAQRQQEEARQLEVARQRWKRQQEAKAKVKARDAERRIKRTKRIIRRELASYEKAGERWRNILIRRHASKEDLIELGKRLHQEDPAANFRFLDDDERFQQFMDWDKNYPDPMYPSPEEWVEKHYVAMINKMLDPATGEVRWQLSTQYGDALAVLE